jgi:SAM-dependent methyltransferase
MSRWGAAVTRTPEDATRFWAEAPRETLYDMMETPRWAWVEWLRVAAGVITSPGAVFEPGCGVGLLTEVLPAGCTYYGCDVNAGYIEEARQRRGRPGVTFERRDLYEILGSGERWDWVVVTSLFGMFPEDESYRLIEAFWDLARLGMSVTTIDKRLVPRSRRLRHEFTAHDPDELMAVDLAGVARRELRRGREMPQFKGHHWSRGLALYAWREDPDRAPDA